MTVKEFEILIVEDSATQAKQLKHFLEENHYNVKVAGDGLKAVEAIRQKKPDVVISDILMPEMDGYELAHKIKNELGLCDLPVILVTSLSDPLDIVKGLECGADNFITKPYESEYLLSRINHFFINREITKYEKTYLNLEFFFFGKKYTINSDRKQILDLLLSTYETAVQKNLELIKTQEELRNLNEHLESIVEERTGDLMKEVSARRKAEEEMRESNHKLRETLAELKAAQEQVVQQERLRAIGTMAAGIAHDFNNALSPIQGYSDLFLAHPENLDNKEKILHALKIINLAAMDAAKIVSRLREFYRHREQNDIFSPVDVNKLIEDVVSLTKPKWKDQALAEGVSIDVKTELGDVPLVIGSEPELRDVLTNLIFNATDAMPRGGTISVATTAEEKQVILKISDNGVGMTEEVRRRCFEPFYSTKGERGTGLGLSVVFGIIKRHDGKIEAQSQPGKGTAFLITLPVAKEPVIFRPDRDRKIERSLCVLLVDDEPGVREVLAEYLMSDGHIVETAENGQEGLQKFHAQKYDLIITDRGMPGMSGMELASLIKQLDANKPVIMLTGFGDMMEATGEPSYADLIVGKPVTVTKLREALVKAMKNS